MGGWRNTAQPKALESAETLGRMIKRSSIHTEKGRDNEKNFKKGGTEKLDTKISDLKIKPGENKDNAGGDQKQAIKKVIQMREGQSHVR